MSLDKNRIICAIWFLATVLILKAAATPLFGISGTRTGKVKTQIYSEVRFIDNEYDGLFDPSDEAIKCSKGSTFCERTATYPTSEVTSILKEEKKYTELFGTDLVASAASPITIGNRFGGEDEVYEEPMCSSRVRVVYPQIGKTQENNWRYIVNHSNYTQGVRVEECIHDRHSLCQKDFGNKYRCKQNYIFRQLVSIDEEGNTIKDAFKMPSCCQCVKIQTYGQRKRGF